MNFILRNKVNRSLDQPLLAWFVLLIGPLVEVRDFSHKEECLLFMNHHNIADSVDHFFARLEEELGLAPADLLFTILRLALLVHWVFNDAVLILL